MDIEIIQAEFLETINRYGKMRYDNLFQNLSKREYETLTVIWRYMESSKGVKGIYVSKLAKILKVSQPAVSRMIGTLEEKGYIKRDIDKEDRRNTYVYITGKGIEARKQSESNMQLLMEKIIMGMDKEDLKELILLWNKLADIMEEELNNQKKGHGH